MNGNRREIRYIELFAGAGGFRLGIERATIKEGDKNGQSDILNAKCVFANEWDKHCCEVYNKNFKTRIIPTDIRTIKAGDVPDFDLLCGGFPCQAFSIAGKRRGFQDTRGTLFFEVARILEAKRPQFVFLENVKGLLNHNKGKTFRIIIQTLSELGYDVQWMVFNSKFFGVPQNRERVFIIGSIRGTGRPEILPFREGAKFDIGQPTPQVARTVTSQYYKQGQWDQYIIRKQFDASGTGYKSQQDRVYDPNGIMCCLPNYNPVSKLNIFDEESIR